MTSEESEPSYNFSHIIRFLEDSESFFPSSLDDTTLLDDIYGYYPWWEWGQAQEPNQNLIQTNPADSINSNNDADMGANTTVVSPESPLVTPDNPPPHNASRKRCATDGEFLPLKRPGGSKRKASKPRENNNNNSNEKDKRWAEQLLNPCAAALMAGNSSRVEHFLYVLRELASLTGDANRRLAAHGLRALHHYLSLSQVSPSSSFPLLTFGNAEPKLFQQSLLKFYEVSPWFAFPNYMANSSIMQILAEEPDKGKDLHILDIGVSHGMQWPTLLEALTHGGGPPPRVRITVISVTAEYDQSKETLFSAGPPGHNYSSQLLSFSKSLNINLEINELKDYPLLNLNDHIITASGHENLIICAQFRVHHIHHNERFDFLKVLHSLEPKGVVLCENEMECTCSDCADFATGFSRRTENLWSFLDSTNSAFKGHDCEERKVIEGEAAKVLTSNGQMYESKAKWVERMREVGYIIDVFKDDAIDGARSLLRKYDSHWEMRAEETGGSVELLWKGEPVSFCSLWKTAKEPNDD